MQSNVPSHFPQPAGLWQRTAEAAERHCSEQLPAAGTLSNQGLEFGPEELGRAEPSAQELQLPAGWVQPEQSHVWQPSPYAPTVRSRSLSVRLHV